MFGEQAVFEPQDVNHDPVHGQPDPRKPAVEHDVVALGDDQRIIVAQLFGQGLDEFEEPLAPRGGVSAMLNVVRRPKALRSSIVPLVEKRFERGLHQAGLARTDRAALLGLQSGLRAGPDRRPGR
jgi:hypothetical protein